MTNNSTPRGPNTGTNVDRSSSVEKILNEMNRSFALCTKTNLFQFYNSACKKGSECSINWTSNNIFLNPLSSIANNSTNSFVDAKTQSTAFSWISSIDFWRRKGNDSASSGNTGIPENAISTMSSSSYDLYERLGTLSNQLVTENRIVTGITQQLDEKLNQLISSLKFTTAGVFFGAVAGAAVATGVMVGMMAASGVIGAAGSGQFSAFLRVMRRRLGLAPPPPKGGGSKDHESDEVSGNSSSSTIIASNGPLVLLQGNPSAFGSIEEQCFSCFQNITSNLRQEDMSWKDIRRISAYLVAKKCEANNFRKLFEEFTIQSGGPSAKVPATGMPLISILFVTQLENEQAILQVEVMACK